MNVVGLREVQKMLDEAPKNIVLLGYGRALTAGINILAGALISKTRVRTGALAQALVVEVTVDSDARGGEAAVGFGDQGRTANWLEYGHRIVKKGGFYIDSRGRRRKGTVTGQVPAYPFVRPAFDTSGDAAIEAFADTLASTLKSAY